MIARRRVPVSIAVCNESTESLLTEIDAMLADKRYKTKWPAATSVRTWIREHGTHTSRQRELIDNIRRKVEGQ